MVFEPRLPQRPSSARRGLRSRGCSHQRGAPCAPWAESPGSAAGKRGTCSRAAPTPAVEWRLCPENAGTPRALAPACEGGSTPGETTEGTAARWLPVSLRALSSETGGHQGRSLPLPHPQAQSPGTEVLCRGGADSKRDAPDHFPGELTSRATGNGDVQTQGCSQEW